MATAILTVDVSAMPDPSDADVVGRVAAQVDAASGERLEACPLSALLRHAVAGDVVRAAELEAAYGEFLADHAVICHAAVSVAAVDSWAALTAPVFLVVSLRAFAAALRERGGVA